MRRMMKMTLVTAAFAVLCGSPALALVYTGAMDNRAGFPQVPGFTAQSQAWTAGGDGLRLEWQADDESSPGLWTYSYRLIRGSALRKGFAFFDIETSYDFSAYNIKSRSVVSARNRFGTTILSGISSITISDPVSFSALHDFSNAPATERNFATVLDKSELSHYSGDPGRVPAGEPGGAASATESVGPVPHPFYGIRVTFPGSFTDLAYEVSDWEFSVVTDRAPMWGSFFGWGDQTIVSPFWYANFYNDNIDAAARLELPPADSTTGEAPYRGWILVPGPSSFPDGILVPGHAITSVADALAALRIAVHLVEANPQDLAHGDIAPLGPDGLPRPDGQIGLSDALALLAKAAGLIGW